MNAQERKKIARDSRIAVAGAGPAGISCALYLKEAGFTNVKVLEKESFPGGKCRTFKKNGLTWEMGAVLGTTDYRETLGIMRKAGISPGPLPSPSEDFSDEFIEDGYWPLNKVFPGWITLKELPRALTEIAKYHRIALKLKRAFEPGMDGVGPALSVPYADWARRQGFRILPRMEAIPYTSFGYGYYEDVPAAYVLKYFEPGIVRSLVNKNKFFGWEDGVQSLWEKAANLVDVEYSVDIKSFRRGDGIDMDTDKGRKAFDELIVCCPADDLLSRTEMTAEEKTAMGSLRHEDYYVHQCEIDSFALPEGFCPGRLAKAGMGLPMIWNQRQKSENVYTFYTLSDWKLTPEEIRSNMEKDIRFLGGKLKSILAESRWKYFPHVDAATFKGGYYERLEAMQGKNHTWLAGELMSFSTVEQTIRYSKHLVNRFFSPV